MAVRVESQEIPEALDGDDGAGDCILLWDNGLEKHFQRVPCTSAQFGEESPIIEEVSPEDLWYAKNEMTVWYSLEHFLTEPFPEFHRSVLVAGGAEWLLSTVIVRKDDSCDMVWISFGILLIDKTLSIHWFMML